MEPSAYEKERSAVRLDMKDTRILCELDSNARQPLSRIAKKVGLSKEVVKYRIQAMEREGVIRGYYAVIDLSKIGYMFCRILIKFQETDMKREKEIIEYCKSSKHAGWICMLDDLWDLVFIVYVKDVAELEKIHNELVRRYGRYVLEKDISIASSIYHFKHNYLFGTKDHSQAVLGEESKKVELDKTDLKILEILANNARIPTIEIADKLGMSANAIKYRIKGLMKSKVIIGFRTKINLSLLGYEHYKIFLTLKSVTKEKMEKLMGYLRFHPNVIYITKAIGTSDLEFEAMLKNRFELHSLMRELRLKFGDILKGYQTILTYEEILINYLPRGCAE